MWNRVVGLILDVDINVFPPPDEDPSHVDEEGHKIVLFQHRLQDSFIHAKAVALSELMINSSSFLPLSLLKALFLFSM